MPDKTLKRLDYKRNTDLKILCYFDKLKSGPPPPPSSPQPWKNKISLNSYISQITEINMEPHHRTPITTTPHLADQISFRLPLLFVRKKNLDPGMKRNHERPHLLFVSHTPFNKRKIQINDYKYCNEKF